MAGKWNYATREYDDYELPKRAALYSNNMDEIVDCASCGKPVVFDMTYSSLEIHTQMGLGYAVCPACHAKEMERALRARECEDTDIMKKDIECLDLSVRTYNCLKRAGISTVGDLCSRPKRRIMIIRGMGAKGLCELTDRMSEMGIWFDES